MKNLFEYFGKILTFEEYILSEAVKPKETSYGTNYDYGTPLLNDMNISDDMFGDLVVSTGFISKGMIYIVSILKTGEIAFISEEVNNSKGSYSNDSIFSSDNTKNKSLHALEVFSKVLYVIIKLLKEYPKDKVFFKAGTNAKLDRIYHSIVKNKVFTESISATGFKLIKTEGPDIIFKKGDIK